MCQKACVTHILKGGGAQVWINHMIMIFACTSFLYMVGSFMKVVTLVVFYVFDKYAFRFDKVHMDDIVENVSEIHDPEVLIIYAM